MNRSRINHHYILTLAELWSHHPEKNSQAFRFLEMVIVDRMWKCRFVKELGREVIFGCFEEFVEAPLPEGLGMRVQSLKELCAHDEKVTTLIESELNRKNGSAKSLKTSFGGNGKKMGGEEDES